MSLVCVSDVLELVCEVLRHEQRDSDGFDLCVAPALIVNAASPVDVVDIVTVLWRPPQGKVRDLKVVVEDAMGMHHELWFDGALTHVIIDGSPQTGNTPQGLNVHHEAVLEATIAHQSEDVVADRTHYVRVVIQSPNVLQSREDRLIVHRLGMKATHVTIADRFVTDSTRHC